MIGKAHKMGLLTTPYAFNKDEAMEMAKAGADIIVAHMGLTTSGSIGAKTTVTLEESVARVQDIADAAHRINPNAIVLCHGGITLTRFRFKCNYYWFCSFFFLPSPPPNFNSVSNCYQKVIYCVTAVRYGFQDFTPIYIIFQV